MLRVLEFIFGLLALPFLLAWAALRQGKGLTQEIQEILDRMQAEAQPRPVVTIEEIHAFVFGCIVGFAISLAILILLIGNRLGRSQRSSEQRKPLWEAVKEEQK